MNDHFASHPSWCGAERAAREGCLTGRRVQVMRMKSRLDLVGKTGKAISRSRDGTSMRYRVLLDSSTVLERGETVNILVENLEAISELGDGEIRGGGSLQTIAQDTLEEIFTLVLVRDDRPCSLVGGVFSYDGRNFSPAETQRMGYATWFRRYSSCRAEGRCVPHETLKRFAALSSVSFLWLEAAKAAASAQLAALQPMASARVKELKLLLSERGIKWDGCVDKHEFIERMDRWVAGEEVAGEGGAKKCARLEGRARMFRRLHSSALPKPPKSRPSPFQGIMGRHPISTGHHVRNDGVHVMTGDPSTWHFREDGTSASQARANARMDAEARRAMAYTPLA